MIPRFRQLRCSFCRKTESQVRKLVAGPKRAFICDGCVAEAQRVMSCSGSAPTATDRIRDPLISRLINWLRRTVDWIFALSFQRPQDPQLGRAVSVRASE